MKSRTLLSALPCVLVIAGCRFPIGSPDEAGSAEPLQASARVPGDVTQGLHLQSDVRIVIDESAAARNHVPPATINSRVKEFITSHDGFTLADLQNIKIFNTRGHDVLLQEVAAVQVEFHRAN